MIDTVEMTTEEWSEHRGSYDGICLACGDIQEGGVEPDAKEYECSICGEKKVQGIEHALMTGTIEITDADY